MNDRPGPSIDIVADVLDFHERVAPNHVQALPGGTTGPITDLKMGLVREEFEELNLAVAAQDISGIADACADLIYVVIGLALAFGIDLRPVWRAVHAANLLKAGGPRSTQGKLLKPPGWRHPDIKEILGRQMPLLEGWESGEEEAQAGVI